MPAKTGYVIELISLTSLFFMWGFITSLNDILIPYFKNAFELNFTQAMLIQFCFFGAYFVMSLPAGKLVSFIGFKKGIVTGLVLASIGCLLFYPSAALTAYPLFLLSLFILASGVTLLQVSANPFVTVLGSPQTASARLVTTQAFNSLGTTLGPLFGALLLFATSEADSGIESVKTPYLLLAGTLLFLALFFSKLRLPDFGKSTPHLNTPNANKGAWHYRHLKLGAIGIFVYVGAEVAIGSFLVSFIQSAGITGITETQAATYVSYYWGGAMVGRFIGALVMQKVRANRLLSFNALMACVLIVITLSSDGNIAIWSLLLVGVFNSIMFPTIFSLSLHGLGNATSQGSGILCLAIVGGAIVPLAQGMLADSLGLQPAFIIPVLCYLYILYYGLSGYTPSRPQRTDRTCLDSMEKQ
nr:sugar MFS transporter [Alteromonas sp. a30]